MHTYLTEMGVKWDSLLPPVDKHAEEAKRGGKVHYYRANPCHEADKHTEREGSF